MNIKKLTKNKIFLIIMLIIIAALLVVAYFVMKNNGWLEIFESTQKLQEYVSGFGIWAPLVFMALQIVQVIISPIPGNITTLAGGVMFGFTNGFLLSFAAIFIGSIMAFGLARMFGKPLVIKMVGEDVTHKYIDVMSSRQKVVLIFMFLLPFFPDDALCLIAGISGVSWPFFIVTLLLARPAGIVFSALIGSGAISMPIWGWAIIIVVSVAAMILSVKYAPQINDFTKKHVIDRFKKSDKKD